MSLLPLGFDEVPPGWRRRATPLGRLFHPRSIAVIGASRDPQKLGYILLDNLIKNRFPGRIYPVNPHAKEVLWRRAYPSVSQIPRPVDLALVVVPAPLVVPVVAECGAKGVPVAVVISAGFRESGEEGRRREEELLTTARRYNMRVVGPNSLGVIDTFASLNASFAQGMPARWEIGMMSQSGAVASAIMDWAHMAGVGFSKFVSLGNMADVNELDLLHYWWRDRQCKVIVAYLETLTNGRQFLWLARDITRTKPVVAMKVGATAAGARAAHSHTGAMAQPDRIVDAALRQAGVTRAYTMEELFDFTKGFAYMSSPRGRAMAVVTNAGGPGVMTADAMEPTGLNLAPLASTTRDKLALALPSAASRHNPVDILGDATADRYGVALEAVLADPGVDGVVVLLTPQAITEPEASARAIVAAAKTTPKPILAVFMGGVVVSRARDILDEGRVPVYPYPERAVRTLAVMANYASYRRQARMSPRRSKVLLESIR